MSTSSINYQHLKDVEDGEETASSTDYCPQEPRRAPSLRTWVARGIWLCSGWIAFLLLILYGLNEPLKPDYSFKGMGDLPRRSTKFQGSFRSDSPYRGPPGPDVDAAWERYTASPWIDGTAVVLGVDEDEVIKSGKHLDQEWANSTVHLEPENGGGVMATLEIFHQLHCLDLIRKYTHYTEYKSTLSLVDTDPDLSRNHIDHCIEIIRQSIMCHADTELIIFHWVEGVPNPYPDFNVWHTCRDPEQVLQMAKEREAPMKHRVKKPKDAVEMPTPP
ncbi:hypothetical protein F5Y19DRAFT_445625 [Xylariaceae sp. FL1651]|nr:hypothetical protein F5Y19DRAFT_445625 [Xylariaceae sp. FL1651]